MIPGNSQTEPSVQVAMTVESIDDLELVAAARAGRVEAFGRLVERYQDRLFATVARLTGSSADAADVLQECFVRAFRKLPSFHGESSFYTWLYRIAVNLSMSHRRQRKRNERHVVTHGELREVIDPPSIDDPSLPLERAELERTIQHALNALDPAHRAIIVMKDLDGLQYEEIARILHLPIGTVRSRLHRARLALRDRLSRVDWTEPHSTSRAITRSHRLTSHT
jgi:RNA polymerase sigma-70 factor (ECF subfamily)